MQERTENGLVCTFSRLFFCARDVLLVGDERFVPVSCDEHGWHMSAQSKPHVGLRIGHARLWRNLADGTVRLLVDAEGV